MNRPGYTMIDEICFGPPSSIIMSYLKLGWNWIRLAITQQLKIQVYLFLSGLPDPQPAIASRRQHDRSFQREFTILKRIPAS
jgi:hypothetical protein